MTAEKRAFILGMVVAFFALMAVRYIIFFGMAAKGNVKLFAYNRIYAVYVAEFFKVERTKHVSVVCERKSGHIKAFSLCNKRVKLSTAVKKRIIGVYMEVNKIRYRRPLRRWIKNMNVCHNYSMFENCV